MMLWDISRDQERATIEHIVTTSRASRKRPASPWGGWAEIVQSELKGLSQSVALHRVNKDGE
jgi:hypothetical protein